MTQKASMSNYISPRRRVPQELKGARIGKMDQGALGIAYLIKRRLKTRGPNSATVLVDIDGTVYCARKPVPILMDTVSTYPEIVVGVYNRDVDAGDLAADLESVRRVA